MRRHHPTLLSTLLIPVTMMPTGRHTIDTQHTPHVHTLALVHADTVSRGPRTGVSQGSHERLLISCWCPLLLTFASHPRELRRVSQVPFSSASFWQGLQFAVQIHHSGSTCNCFGRWNFVAASTFIDGGARRWCARPHQALLGGFGRGRSDGPRTRPAARRPAAAVLPTYAHVRASSTQDSRDSVRLTASLRLLLWRASRVCQGLISSTSFWRGLPLPRTNPLGQTQRRSCVERTLSLADTGSSPRPRAGGRRVQLLGEAVFRSRSRRSCNHMISDSVLL